MAGMASERITVLEDPNYARFTLSTLLRLADALDVALIVRFAPFSELLKWASHLSSNAVDIPQFAEDKELNIDIAAKQTLPEYDESVLELFGTKKRETGQQNDSAIRNSLFSDARPKDSGNGFPYKPIPPKSPQQRLAAGGL